MSRTDHVADTTLTTRRAGDLPSVLAVRHFAAAFAAATRKQRRRTARWVGVELEYPVVDRDGRAARPSAVRRAFRGLTERGWLASTDPRGLPTGAHRFAGPGRAHVITTDIGAATVEIQLAAAPTVHSAEQALSDVLADVRPLFAEQGLLMLGYGVQPAEPLTGATPTAGDRYRQLLRAARRDPDGGSAGRRICLSASSQVHVDVGADEAGAVVSDLNATAGLRIALLANSAHAAGVPGLGLARREAFWDEAYGDRPGQVGVVGPFTDLDAYARHLVGLRAFGVQRGDGYHLLDTTATLAALLDAGVPVPAIDPGGSRRHVRVRPEDACAQYGVGWFAARLNPVHGTVEDRVACQQPPGDQLVNAALVLGLVEARDQLGALVASRDFARWRALRHSACTHGLRAAAWVRAAAGDLLVVAGTGLRRRGFGEEEYLEPLHERLAERRSPADVLRAVPAADRLRWILAHRVM